MANHEDGLTWNQALAVLELAKSKGTSREQMTKLLSSGFLADLLDANVDAVDREEFRGIIGIDPRLNIEDYELVPIFLKGEKRISQELLFERARVAGALTGGKEAAAFFFNRNRILVEWRNYELVFPKTGFDDRGQVCDQLHGFTRLHWGFVQWNSSCDTGGLPEGQDYQHFRFIRRRAR